MAAIAPKSTQAQDHQRQLVDEVCELYATFQTVDYARLAAIYNEDVIFRDPVHQLTGLVELCHYMNAMAENLNYCNFEFTDRIYGQDQACLAWKMHYSHPSIKRGADLVLDGSSILKIDQHISMHQDYYDLGAMLYEHLPVIGSGVRFIKKKLQG